MSSAAAPDTAIAPPPAAPAVGPPRSMRAQIALFGRTNVGKSTLLNAIAGQDVALVSPAPGTTTDAVEKAMEWLPIGPVVFLDTAGLDDGSALGERRRARTARIFDRADVALLVAEADTWTDHEARVLDEARRRACPCVVVVNKADRRRPSPAFLARLREQAAGVAVGSARDPAGRARLVTDLKAAVAAALGRAGGAEPSLLDGLVPEGGLVVLVTPIDAQAPKGRLILPQVRALRDALDRRAIAVVVQESELAPALALLGRGPDLVVCDSQVVERTAADTPAEAPLTTFSILMARIKGDLASAAAGAAAIEALRAGDRVLVAESCSHHPGEDDIGRVKIPRWIRRHAGVPIDFDIRAGRDLPEDLAGYRLIVHCGACMLTRREMQARLRRAAEAGVAVTNYGLAIAAAHGVLARLLMPFPEAFAAWRTAARRAS